MSIRNYFNKLRESDEKSKHRSALTISITLSIIILLILFFIFGKSYFNINNLDKNIESNQSLKTEGRVKEERTSELESPATSLKNFFKETGSQFSSIKSSFFDIFSSISSNTNKKNE